MYIGNEYFALRNTFQIEIILKFAQTKFVMMTIPWAIPVKYPYIKLI